MNESMNKYLRLGTILSMSYHKSMGDEESILRSYKKILKDSDFEVVEVGHFSNRDFRKKLSEMAEVSGVKISYGAQGKLLGEGLSLCDPVPEKRLYAVEVMKQCLDEAYEMKAEDFVFLAGRFEKGKENEYLDLLLDSTRMICAEAEKKGTMKVLCEVFDYDIDKRSLIGPVDRVKRYASQMSREYDNFGLLIDLSHIPMLHESIEESILPVEKYIKHVHIGNTVIKNSYCKGYGDNHPRFGFPNSENGVEEVANFIRVLFDVGFFGKEERPILSFEVKPFEDEDEDLVLANAKRTLKSAWNKV